MGDGLSYLAQRALIATYNKGETILRELAHPMNSVFLIVRGSVKQLKDSFQANSHRKLTGFVHVRDKGSSEASPPVVLKEGDTFGLANMLFDRGQSGGFPSESSYVAAERHTRIMAVHLHDFLHVMPRQAVAQLYKELEPEFARLSRTAIAQPALSKSYTRTGKSDWDTRESFKRS